MTAIQRRDGVAGRSAAAAAGGVDGNLATERRRSLPSAAASHTDTTDEAADGDADRKCTPVVGPSRRTTADDAVPSDSRRIQTRRTPSR